MEEEQLKLKQLKDKYIKYKVATIIFLVVLFVISAILLFVPTIKLDIQKYLLTTADYDDILSESQQKSLYSYMKNSSVTMEQFATYVSCFDGRQVSFLELMIFTWSGDVYPVLSRDLVGFFSFVFATVIGFMLLLIMLTTFVKIITNLIFVSGKRNIQELVDPATSGKLRNSKLFNRMKFFSSGYCVNITIAFATTFLLQLMVALSKQHGIYVNNAYGSMMPMSLQFLPISYVLPILGCILMYVFTFISSKLNPFYE